MDRWVGVVAGSAGSDLSRLPYLVNYVRELYLGSTAAGYLVHFSRGHNKRQSTLGRDSFDCIERLSKPFSISTIVMDSQSFQTLAFSHSTTSPQLNIFYYPYQYKCKQLIRSGVDLDLTACWVAPVEGTRYFHAHVRVDPNRTFYRDLYYLLLCFEASRSLQRCIITVR
jgi:hypothetical protein